MAVGVAVYIAIGLLVWALASLFNSPVPKGYKDPWKLRAIFAMMKLMRIKDYFMGFFMEPEDLLVAMRASLKSMIKAPDITQFRLEVEDLDFDGVPVRVYRPANLKPNHNPGIIHYHGGGWAVGDRELCHEFCGEFAHETNTVLVSVEYRLAPEHIYPAGPDDCLKATLHFMKEADRFGVDPSRIALMGDSAGGNLAASTALRLRDMKVEPQPKLQVLIYPCLQAVDFQSPSYQANFHDPLLPADLMIKFWLIYATGNAKTLRQALRNHHAPLKIQKEYSLKQLNHQELLKEKRDVNHDTSKFSQETEEVWRKLEGVFTDPYFAPLMSKDLSGLPEAIVLTAEQDVLMSDGIWYAKYLESFGVKVSHKHFESGYHGFVTGLVPKQEETMQGRSFLHKKIKSIL